MPAPCPPPLAVASLLIAAALGGGLGPAVAHAQPPGEPEDEFSVDEANDVRTIPRYAVVVGVSDYDDQAIPDLPVCDLDAKEVYAALTDPNVGGVPKANATLLIGKDASRNGVLKALNALRATPKNATVYFYFSGHGARVGDQTYLIPQDAEASFLAGSALSQNELNRYLEAVPASRMVQFVDACFAAGLRSDPSKPTKAFAADAEAALQSFTGRGRIFFGAAGEDEEALTAPDKQRSVFTLHLLDGLKGGADENLDGVVTAFEVQAYLDRTVSVEAAQRGGLHSPRVEFPADVVNPSRYPLTINAAALESRTAAAKLLRTRLNALEAFFYAGKLNLARLELARDLVKRPEKALAGHERIARDEVLAAIDRGSVDARMSLALDRMGAPSLPAAPKSMHLRATVPAPLTLEGHDRPVAAVAVLPDGWRAVSASADGTLKVWNLATRTCDRTLGGDQGHGGKVSAVAVTPDGLRAVSGSADQTLKVWDLATGVCERTLEGLASNVTAVAVTPDGKRAVSGAWDKTLRVWDLSTGEAGDPLEGHTNWIAALAITPDGTRAVSASYDNDLRIWNLTTGACERTLTGHSNSVTAVAIAPDGQRAVSASGDGTLKVWNLADGSCERTLEGHSEWVDAVAVTPDGRRAVSGAWDGQLKVWNLSTGVCERTLQGHAGVVNAVAVTPDGGRIVSGSHDDTLRVWDVFEPDR
ncbi:caspase family protein [Alienimonas californiensis]|uniref:WD domain, G-beta repeat n=1 Tax=Alienimonas californiensis TaxID=2527989 RepID=A0A517P6J7_9PLAN|nr:caspase family protein [Alienimonas californiensis]QDT14997.1 WD domain, G-beta repeat [Alienimonas californiensis]